MRKALVSGLLTLTLMAAAVSGAGPAAADPALSGTASGFGALATLMGGELVGPVASATVTAPPFGDDQDNALLDVSPLTPLTFGGAAVAEARVHSAADIISVLETETQPEPGPYNAQGVGALDDLEVLIDVVGPDVPLVEADLVRGEAVAKCVGNTVVYSANSETQNLDVAGRSELGLAVDALLAALFPGLDPLDPLVNIEENVITPLADGIEVDALVITLTEAIDPEGLVQLRVGHAEVSGVTCGTVAGPPECSDTMDNDGDGVIDALDPGCHTDGNPNNPGSYDPNDDDERDLPECSDGVDNDGDGRIDFPADPDCDGPNDDDESPECSDGIDNDGDGKIDFPADPECSSPTDDREAADGGGLARTGTSIPTAAAAGMGVAALALFALRRRTALA